MEAIFYCNGNDTPIMQRHEVSTHWDNYKESQLSGCGEHREMEGDKMKVGRGHTLKDLVY